MIKSSNSKSSKVTGFEHHWFFGPVLKQSGKYTQVIVASICINLFALVSAFFVMTVYDRVIPNESLDTLLFLTIGVSIVILFDFLMKTVRGSLTDKAGLHIDEEVSEALFDHLSRNEKLIGTKPVGSIATIVKEFDSLKDVMASATLVAFADLPFIFIFLVVLYALGGWVAAVPAAVVLLVLLVGLLVQPIIKSKTFNAQIDSQTKNSVLVELLSGLETIKTLKGISLFRKRWKDSVLQQSEVVGQSRFWSQISSNFAQTGQQISQVGIVVYGVILIAKADMTMGSLIACVILSGRVLAPLGQITNLIGRLNQASVAYSNLSDLFSLQSNEGERSKNLQHADINGELNLFNVSLQFEVGTRPALENVSLNIKPGEKVGIIGKVGSGKSSLIKIMAGLVEPTSGYAQIDSIDLSQIQPDDLRNHVSIMLQSPALFSGTLKENLLFGKPNASDDELFETSKITGVDLVAAELQGGFAAVLNEGGQMLSGGQRQAICLTRTLLNKSQILILDEPTSSMDTQTEGSFISNFRSWVGKETVIIATHKGRVLDAVDRVIVLENGRVVADGKKEEVLRPSKPTVKVAK
jgi:ATP-binding cassette, subfamily C, bacterial LapB